MRQLLQLLLIFSLSVPGWAAISCSSLTANTGSPAAGTVATASVTPTSNALVLISVSADLNSGNGPLAFSSVTGNSLTWVNVDAQNYASAVGSATRQRVEVWRAMGSATAGAITVHFATTPTTATWAVTQCTGVNTGGTNGSAAVGNINQAASAGPQSSPGTVTLTFAGSTSGTYATLAGLGGTTLTAGTSLTVLGNTNANPSLIDEWAAGNVSPDTVTYTGTLQWGMISVELKPPGSVTLVSPFVISL